jgi:hypothetical protein
VRSAALALGLALMAAIAGCTTVLNEEGTTPPTRAAADVAGDQGKFLTAQGQAGPGGTTDPAQQADQAARAKLASFLSADGAAGSPLAGPFIDTLAAGVSTDILRAAVRRDTWVDADGITHVLYRVPIALVDDKIVEGVRQTVATSNPFGADGEQVAGRMEQFLQNRLAERLKVAARTNPPAPRVAAPIGAQGGTPTWLEADRHADYPSDKFLSAIGLGADEQAASDSARAELAAAIDVRLQGHLRALLAAPSSGPIGEDAEHLDPGSLHFTAKDLAVTRIAERWHDTVTDTYYILAVMDRAAAPSIYRERLSEAQSKAHDLIALAESDLQAHKYAASLVDYLDALMAGTQALRMQLAALAVAPESQATELLALTTEPLVARAKGGLSALLEQFSLAAVSGDDQWVAPGGPPRAPLVVQAVAGPGKVPLPGVPVRMAVPGAKEPVLARTDEAGTARCAIPGPLPAAPRRGTVTATLDLARLAAGADLSGLKVPSVEFHYALHSRADTIVAVYLYDVGTAGAAAPVTGQLKAALSDAGWRIMDDATVLGNVRAGKPAPDAPPADAVDAAGLRHGLSRDQSLLVAVGSLDARLADTVKVTEGNLKIVHCDYRIALLDAEAGEPLLTVMTASGQGRGAYTDDEVEAAARATADASTDICKKVLAELTARFGAPAAP